MKKKLEAELISIAHRILKLKNKSELVQLHQEVQKLYENLSVLRFLEEQFDDVKPTIGRAEAEAKLETVYEQKSKSVEIPSEPLSLKEDEFAPIAVFMPEEVTEDRGFEDEEIDATNVLSQEEQPGPPSPEIEKEPAPEVPAPHVIEIGEEEPEPQPEPEEEPEPAEEEYTADEILIRHVLHMDDEPEEAEEETQAESITEEPVEEVKSAPKEISFADLLGHDFSEPIFERVEDIKSNTVETPVFEKKPLESAAPVEDEPHFKADESKVDHLHDAHHKAITFGLNDKIGFEKHLFGGSSEDMNRVVSQLGSFNSFEEAKEFIEDMVKPDYNNWTGKEDYETRFLEIIERKFN